MNFSLFSAKAAWARCTRPPTARSSVVAFKVIRPEMAHPEILPRFKQELLLSSQVTTGM